MLTLLPRGRIRFAPGALPALLLMTLALGLAPRPDDHEPIRLKRIVTGAAKAGQFQPQRLILAPDPTGTVTRLPGLISPLFGEITIGPQESPTAIAVVLDNLEGAKPRLFVDANANGDLTDDPAPEWTTSPYKGGDRKEYTLWNGAATVSVRYGAETRPVRLLFRLYDLADPQRALYKGSILYYSDTGYEGEVTLGGQTYRALLTDGMATGDFRGKTPGGASLIYLLLDINGNERFDRRGERFDTGLPFNIRGTTYEITEMSASGDSFRIVPSKQSVPEIPPPPDLRPGKKALPFTAKTLDGQTVRFPEDYKGKLALLHFWATWCGDCVIELPNLTQRYAEFHPQGLEALGVSLDKPDSARRLAEFAQQNGVTWRQVYDGKHWKAELAVLYGIEEIPWSYLVDGDTGEVLAAGEDLAGPKLAETLQKVLKQRSK
jgi:peroxiredoxin